MTELSEKIQDGKLLIFLSGRIDSNNAPMIEAEAKEMALKNAGLPIEINASSLEYISSAGLRFILHLKKTNPDICIREVRTNIYDIFEMTGFTQMMQVEKAYRKVSVEGAEEIGRGANGVIYRIDQDNVVKVYRNADALKDIKHEREVAKLALVLGIPTAISYDVVKVGDTYGSVFELLNAKSFSKIIASQPEKIEWCEREYVKLLKKIHGTVVPEGKLPDARETALDWARFLQDYLPEASGKKLLDLIQAIPHDDHMIHGDFHTNNIELQNDEVLLIDMDTLSVGNPIFELSSMYNSFIGYGEYNQNIIKEFFGFDFETSRNFFHKVLELYLENSDPKKINEVEDKARIIGYTRMIRRSIRRQGLESEGGRNEIECWKKSLLELIEKTDSLVFTKDVLEVDADTSRLSEVLSYIEKKLEGEQCPSNKLMEISVSAEEIFVNIANYAYAPGKGKAYVSADVNEETKVFTMVFSDGGKPFNPLAKPDPDITLSAEERDIGGLGIFMTKKMMDQVIYEYKDGRNVLTLRKNLK